MNREPFQAVFGIFGNRIFNHLSLKLLSVFCIIFDILAAMSDSNYLELNAIAHLIPSAALEIIPPA